MHKIENVLFVEVFGASSIESSMDADNPHFTKCELPALACEDPLFKFAASTPEAERHTADVLRKALQEEIIGDGAYVTDPRTGAIVFREFSAKPISREPVREPELDFLKGFDLYELGSFDARLDHLLDNLKKGVKQRCPCDCVACGDDRCAECCADRRKCETNRLLNSSYPERKVTKSAESLPMSKRFSESFEDYLWSDNPHINDLKEAFKTSDPDEARERWKAWKEAA